MYLIVDCTLKQNKDELIRVVEEDDLEKNTWQRAQERKILGMLNEILAILAVIKRSVKTNSKRTKNICNNTYRRCNIIGFLYSITNCIHTILVRELK